MYKCVCLYACMCVCEFYLRNCSYYTHFQNGDRSFCCSSRYFENLFYPSLLTYSLPVPPGPSIYMCMCMCVAMRVHLCCWHIKSNDAATWWWSEIAFIHSMYVFVKFDACFLIRIFCLIFFLLLRFYSAFFCTHFLHVRESTFKHSSCPFGCWFSAIKCLRQFYSYAARVCWCCCCWQAAEKQPNKYFTLFGVI